MPLLLPFIGISFRPPRSRPLGVLCLFGVLHILGVLSTCSLLLSQKVGLPRGHIRHVPSLISAILHELSAISQVIMRLSVVSCLLSSCTHLAHTLHTSCIRERFPRRPHVAISILYGCGPVGMGGGAFFSFRHRYFQYQNLVREYQSAEKSPFASFKTYIFAFHVFVLLLHGRRKAQLLFVSSRERIRIHSLPIPSRQNAMYYP